MQRPILALVHENSQMAAMLAAQHHAVIRTSRVTEAGDGTELALCQALVDLARAWRQQQDPTQPNASPYSTRASVRQMLDWNQALGGAPR
jgi:hypothetical protein